jgi:alanine racemase
MDALAHNWRWFAEKAGPARCGAAVKANGYGVGAKGVAARLAREGCRDFFVATWREAVQLGDLPEGVQLSVLHGVQASDMARAVNMNVKPVLCTPGQVGRWREAAAWRPCDVMLDTGMNRLGLSLEQAASGLLAGLNIDTVHSHLSCADEPDHPMNRRQLVEFRGLSDKVPHRRLALANSAGVCLGADYGFDLVRPGLGLYGGVPHPAAKGMLQPVAGMQAKVVQVRDVPVGGAVGYNATFVAKKPTRVAILNLGYADGLPRSIAELAHARVGEIGCPILGRISMDLTAIDISAVPYLREEEWVDIVFDLAAAARVCGLSQYELLTGLGGRFDRMALSS